MIKNRFKIEACVKNAKQFVEIVNKFGSFKEYIDFYSPDSNEDALYKFKRSLEKTFIYIGGITSYHFMTDIGLNVLKPDRVILRIFERLGLIEYRNDYFGAIKVGRAFSQAINLPIRYIDIIFVSYGQLDNGDIMTICSEAHPKCDMCGVNQECLYYKLNVI
jgi:DNA-3-methyladenine glycosylase I